MPRAITRASSWALSSLPGISFSHSLSLLKIRFIFLFHWNLSLCSLQRLNHFNKYYLAKILILVLCIYLELFPLLFLFPLAFEVLGDCVDLAKDNHVLNTWVKVATVFWFLIGFFIGVTCFCGLMTCASWTCYVYIPVITFCSAECVL